MTYLTQAHARLVHGIINSKPAVIPISPAPEDFEAQAEHIKELRSLLAEYLSAVAADGSQNATGNSINSEVTGFVGDSLGDFASQFEEEAEGLRNDNAEFAADRSGWSKAHAMGVD